MRLSPTSSLLLAAASLPFLSSASLYAPLVTREELGVETTRPVECERKTVAGDKIKVNYRGTLQSDGTEFDSSYGRKPFEFILGMHQVIDGWDIGLMDMCVGEARTLTIPPEYGYGSQSMGPIPGGSTLIFETELLGIDGVVLAPSNDEETDGESKDTSASAEPKKGSENGPGDDKENSGECELLGPFALLVQGALGLLAVLSLVYKRWREKPRRPVKIWAFDASKQVVGSVLLHLANLLMSMLSSGKLDVVSSTKAAVAGQQPNPCSFYLLNLAIDTTIGIPILVVLLRLLHHAFLLTPLARPPQSIKSGVYGSPPRVTWWAKQSLIYFLGLMGMKLCVFFIFQLLPWIAWVGDWALRWTEGNTALQIAFVMFVFPLVMNAMQYYIIDSFIKDTSGGAESAVGDEGGSYTAVADGDADRHGARGSFEWDSEDDEPLGGHGGEETRALVGKSAKNESRSGLKEANPTTVPVYEERFGAGSGSSSSTERVDVAGKKMKKESRLD